MQGLGYGERAVQRSARSHISKTFVKTAADPHALAFNAPDKTLFDMKLCPFCLHDLTLVDSVR